MVLLTEIMYVDVSIKARFEVERAPYEVADERGVKGG